VARTFTDVSLLAISKTLLDSKNCLSNKTIGSVPTATPIRVLSKITIESSTGIITAANKIRISGTFPLDCLKILTKTIHPTPKTLKTIR
jgi:hypothetical protein